MRTLARAASLAPQARPTATNRAAKDRSRAIPLPTSSPTQEAPTLHGLVPTQADNYGRLSRNQTSPQNHACPEIAQLVLRPAQHSLARHHPFGGRLQPAP